VFRWRLGSKPVGKPSNRRADTRGLGGVVAGGKLGAAIIDSRTQALRRRSFWNPGMTGSPTRMGLPRLGWILAPIYTVSS